MYSNNVNDLLNKAEEVLSEIPLCDRCLGRLFASFGLGLSNPMRGRALKAILSMKVHQEILEGKPDSLRKLATLARNGGPVFAELAKKYVGHVEREKCSVCGDQLDSIIGKLVEVSLKKLSGLELSTFIVGVKSGSSIEEKEKEIASVYGITSWETIKREIKREIGKRIQTLTGLKPDFRTPDAVIIIDLDKGEVNVEPTPVYILGAYIKLGRYISQMRWIGRRGQRNYMFSVEESMRKVVPLFEGNELVFHASGREDADARMLGNGRPLILEVRRPQKRKVGKELIERVGSSDPWVILKIKKIVGREKVKELKSATPRKTYRVIAYSPEGVVVNDIEKIENEFKNALINQRTPSRVLRRRPDIVRNRQVYEVKGRILNNMLVEFMIHCDGGLYVKELVHGDQGRTKPSFSEVIGKPLEVLFLDVLEHEHVSL